ncbi:MAG: metallophosphoesterase [Clostridia bacterium]|nr:metallophosphoesterase [Clostridia bacterium]
MTYVVSDLHGCFAQFKRLLQEIRFTDNDVMYVLGDIVDYGDESMELLCDLSMRFNIIPIVGDHDYRALRLLRELDKMLRDGAAPDPEVLGEMTEWIQDGGQKTMEGFKELDDDMKEGILEYLEDLSLYEEVEVKGKRYLLLHAGIAGFDPDSPLEDYMPEDFISEPLDPNGTYFDGVTVIAGHVPTYTLPDAEKGKIYRSDSCILMDCGTAFGEALGCLCLETGKETYVS